MSEHANAFDGDGQARGLADAVARRSYGKLVALLAARTGDLAAAEDALSEAYVSALGKLAAQWVSGEPGSLVAGRRSAKSHRLDPATAHPRDRGQGVGAPCGMARPRGGRRGNSGPPSRFDVHMCPSSHRTWRSCAVDAASRTRIECGDDCLGLPHVSRGHGPAAGGPRARSSRPGFRFESLSVKSFPGGSVPSWTRSTPPSRKAGPTLAGPMSRTAISLRTPCLLVGW